MASTAITFFAYFFLGIGPGVAFFIAFISQKSFLVLLSFFSAFIWLIVLLFTSAIFKGFLPVPETISSYAGVLIGSVFIQEVVRYGVWWMHKKGIAILEKVARVKGHRFGMLDKLYLALAWGYGQSVCHTVFFYLSFLPLTTGSGTLYLSTCTQMSFFLVGALYSIAFGMLLSSIMVIFFDGLHTHNWFHVAYAPAMHITASLMTLVNLTQGGCVIAMPVVLGLGAASMVYTGQLAWRKGIIEAVDETVLAPLATGDGLLEEQELQAPANLTGVAVPATQRAVTRRVPTIVAG